VKGVKVRFLDAGHILGSCAVEVFADEGGVERKIVFSGDLGQYDTPILRDPDPIDRADVVLMESTYGGRRHRDREQTVAELGDILTSARSRQGNILIPAFSIGRSQEIMYQLGKHYEEWGLSRFRIFLDSPMAIEASKVYWENTQLYDEEATRLRLENGGMPLLPNLTLSRSPDDSMAINRIRSGAIVIAGSGMCNGGRIIHHLKHNLDREETQVLITGYQAFGSLGRRLVNREETVRIHGRTIPVRASIHTVGGLSAPTRLPGARRGRSTGRLPEIPGQALWCRCPPPEARRHPGPVASCWSGPYLRFKVCATGGVGYLSTGHVQDIPVHSSAVPDSRRSCTQVPDTSWEALGRSR
jgi:metallo-beta-lactamase family protein